MGDDVGHAVGRLAVDDKDLVNPVFEGSEDGNDVLAFVLGRDDDGEGDTIHKLVVDESCSCRADGSIFL